MPARNIGFSGSIRPTRSKIVAITAAALLGSIVGSIAFPDARYAMFVLAAMTAAVPVLGGFCSYRSRPKIVSMSPVWRLDIRDLRNHRIACIGALAVLALVVVLATSSGPTINGVLGAVAGIGRAAEYEMPGAAAKDRGNHQGGTGTSEGHLGPHGTREKQYGAA